MLAATEPDDIPQMAGSASSVARQSRRMPVSASAPVLPGVTSPSKPPTPPPAFERPRRRSFQEAADDSERSSPLLTPTRKSPPESQNSTPRTPGAVEVRVESQELAVPGACWTADGQLELHAGEKLCTVTVKTGLSGRGGLNVVLRVGLALSGVQDNVVRFKPSAEELSSWRRLHIAGVEECDMGRLPSRSGSLPPRAPLPGSCRHEWTDAKSDPRASEVSAQEAFSLGPSAVSCTAFHCGLNLEVTAKCAVTPDGSAKLRIEVSGELRLLPRFFPAGREGVARLYKAARESFYARDDLKALRSCEEAVTMADVLVPRPSEIGDVLNLMGAIYLRRQNAALAVKCLERALLVREHAGGGKEDLGIASTLTTLGSAHQAVGSHAEALRCHERACSVLKVVAGPSDPTLATCLQSLGGTHRALGSLSDARKCFEQALSIREQVLPPEDPLIAGTLNNLGAVLQSLSDERGAIRCYQKSLQIQMKAYGRDHPTVAATLSNLGSAHSRIGEHQCAVDCHQRALNIQETYLGADDLGVAASIHNLGNALAQSGNGTDAARCLWRALAIWSKAPSPSHCDIAATLHSLGNVYRGVGDNAAASKCFAGALRIRESVLGPTHHETARTRHCAALVGCTLGEESASLQELEVAAGSLLTSLGAQHPWSMQARVDAESLRQVVAP